MATKAASQGGSNFFQSKQDQTNPFRTQTRQQTPQFHKNDRDSPEMKKPQKVSFQDTSFEDEQQIPERERDSHQFGDEVLEIYNQHLREKDIIRTQIEALTREKDFIERLNPDDVLYMLQKKQEAVLNEEIQKFDDKYLKLEQERKKTSGAPNYAMKFQKEAEDELIQILDEDTLDNGQKQKLDKQRIDYKELLDAQKMINRDQYFSKIPDQGVKDLQEKLINLRKQQEPSIDESQGGKSRQNQEELDEFRKTYGIEMTQKLNHVDQAGAYYQAITNYYDGGLANDAEAARQETQQKMQDIRIMDRYLVDFDQSFDIDLEKKQQADISNYMKDKEDQFSKLKQKKPEIKDIKVWTDITRKVDKKSWLKVQEVHVERLQKYRTMKKWDQFCEDDQDDYDTNQVISDIKNLNNEKYFNMLNCAPEDDDFDAFMIKDKDFNKEFNSTMHDQKIQPGTATRKQLDSMFANNKSKK